MSRVALVLCGGQGTRFRDVSQSPKILATIKGVVFLDWILEYLSKNGFNQAVLSIGYRAEEIISYVSTNKENFPINVEFSCEDKPLGTGGAVAKFFNNFESDEVFVFNGDTIWFDQLPEEFFEEKINEAICVTSKMNQNDRYGDFKIVDSELVIRRGTSGHVIQHSDVYIGISRVSREILNNFLNVPFSLEELLTTHKHGVQLCSTEIKFSDFGTLEAYRKLNNDKFS